MDDFSRIGALRYADEDGTFLRSPIAGGRQAPPLIELSSLIRSSRAVESQTETAKDLEYLRGKGTSLGGMRPKCTVFDGDGTLSIGKFPSTGDQRAVMKGEVLALRLAANCGIVAAEARIVLSERVPVALVKRFDREASGRRMYLSARTLLGINDDKERAYTDVADAIIMLGDNPKRDLEELWRRLTFNVLIKNVDDHMHNLGFLYAGEKKWKLSPAFDVNPFPEKAFMLKTWISPDTGPEASVEAALETAPYFLVAKDHAREILKAMTEAIGQWRTVAASPDIGMTSREMAQFVDAFEHDQRNVAAKLSRPIVSADRATTKRKAQR